MPECVAGQQRTGQSAEGPAKTGAPSSLSFESGIYNSQSPGSNAPLCSPSRVGRRGIQAPCRARQKAGPETRAILERNGSGGRIIPEDVSLCLSLAKVNFS